MHTVYYHRSYINVYITYSSMVSNLGVMCACPCVLHHPIVLLSIPYIIQLASKTHHFMKK